jgi:hypothetical protein
MHLFYARLKDRTFGACFWQSVASIVQVNSKSKEMRWKTTKQLEDIFGEEADSMKAHLSQRRHPKNPKVLLHVCAIVLFCVLMQLLALFSKPGAPMVAGGGLQLHEHLQEQD